MQKVGYKFQKVTKVAKICLRWQNFPTRTDGCKEVAKVTKIGEKFQKFQKVGKKSKSYKKLKNC